MNKIFEETKKVWGNLKFWQKGVVVGFLLYMIYSSILWQVFRDPTKIASLGKIFFGIFSIKAPFSVSAIVSFLIFSFGTFGFGFKIITSLKRYYEKGFVFGIWFLIIPTIIIAIDGLTKSSSGEQTGGLAVFVLLAAIPFLAFSCAIVGYVYGKIKGEVVRK